MKFIRPLLITILAVTLAATTASAQAVGSDRAGIARKNLVSANPIGILFEWYNGEFERAVTTTVSLAAAGSIYDFDDVRYTSLDGIARFYPNGRAVRGFSVGMSVGVVSIDDDLDDCEFCNDDSGTSASIGVRGDYVWILGRDQVFTVATGIGAKRLLSDDLDTSFLPIGRLSIGYAW